MKNLIDDGKINTVIVKDLSRFGREHIEADRLLQIEFHQKKIRFISVSESIDSIKGDSEIIPFLNLFNDFYIKDCSKKQKAIKN